MCSHVHKKNIVPHTSVFFTITCIKDQHPKIASPLRMASDVPPYIIALTCLFWVGSLIVCIVCVVNVPQTNAAVFYLMTIDVVLELAKYVLLIVVLNCFLDFWLGFVSLILRRDRESSDAANEYFIAGKKATEEEVSMQSKTCAAYLSICATMEKVLDIEFQRRTETFKSSVHCVGSSVQSDVNVDGLTSRETPVSGASEEVSEIKRADSEGSSLLSAAFTA